MKLKSIVFCLFAGLFVGTVNADIKFSTSSTNSEAGSNLDLILGQTGSIFVWASTETGQTLTGISLDILSSDLSVLEASGNLIANPDSRWLQTEAGTLGDLVDDGYGFALPGIGGTGLSTSGVNDFALFSEIQFTATGLGMTDLNIDFGLQGIGDSGGNSLGGGDLVFGTGSVNVSAVPEPSSLTVLALGMTALTLVRKRRA